MKQRDENKSLYMINPFTPFFDMYEQLMNNRLFARPDSLFPVNNDMLKEQIEQFFNNCQYTLNNFRESLTLFEKNIVSNQTSSLKPSNQTTSAKEAPPRKSNQNNDYMSANKKVNPNNHSRSTPASAKIKPTKLTKKLKPLFPEAQDDSIIDQGTRAILNDNTLSEEKIDFILTKPVERFKEDKARSQNSSDNANSSKNKLK